MHCTCTLLFADAEVEGEKPRCEPNRLVIRSAGLWHGEWVKLQGYDGSF